MTTKDMAEIKEIAFRLAFRVSANGNLEDLLVDSDLIYHWLIMSKPLTPPPQDTTIHTGA